MGPNREKVDGAGSSCRSDCTENAWWWNSQ